MVHGTVKITDLNDFLRPSDLCVLPLGGGMQKSAPRPGSFGAPIYARAEEKKPTVTGTDENDVSGNHVQVEDDTKRPTKVAGVTLSDCISCSGCVTSAETVLMNSEDALNSFREALQDLSQFSVVSLSQQSAASIAERYDVPLAEAYEGIAAFLYQIGASKVYDLAIARKVSLLEQVEEVQSKFEEDGVVLASACPGFVCYAEKKQGNDVLSSISKVKSPQAVMGTIVKRILPKQFKNGVLDGRRIWHACIMPCHDKKIESVREEFQYMGNPEVDAVITTDELVQLMNNIGCSLTERKCLDNDFGSEPGTYGSVGVGSLNGSGGYLEFILFETYKRMLGVKAPSEFEYSYGRNKDFREYTVDLGEGRTLSFAAAYGFRNVQKIVRQIQLRKCKYQYVEIMSCPGGCVNGGGQIADERKDRDLLARVEKLYNQGHKIADIHACADVKAVYSLIGDGVGSASARELFHTSYEQRAGTVSSVLSW